MLERRAGNITPVSKLGSANCCPSDHCPITNTPVIFKVFFFFFFFFGTCWLSL